MKSKFEIGDKVKFLNQIGGGIVTKITDDFIFVEDDSGFDIPMQPEELIRMADQQGAAKMFNLKDQVAKLKKQLSNVQQHNSTTLSDNILLQHTVSPGEAEVDLHIDMLSEHPGNLTAHEAFEIQMHYFRLCMNHAFKNKMKKVTFIHGVGKGILKEEIQKELKQYDNVHFFDAPMSKYGVGATEVYFR